MVDTKKHILETTLQLFLSKSFKEVTMKEIVQKTQLSKGAFYHYFTSKEQVFAEVIKHFYSQMLGEMIVSDATITLKEFYTDLIYQMKKYRLKLDSLPAGQDQQSNHFHLIFDALRMVPGFKDELKRQQQQEIQVWKMVMANAKKKGELKVDLSDEVLARLFISISDGVSIKLILEDRASDQTNELRQLWDALYKRLT